jgi:lipoate-protein ligase B
MSVRVIEIQGLVGYDDALKLQEMEKERVLSGKSPGSIFLLEHDPPVITIGRRGGRENFLAGEDEILRRGYLVRSTGRGGDVTVHEPGQVVAYFVLPVSPKRGASFAGAVLGIVEKAMRRHLPAVRIDYERPGLWIEGRKICSCGFDMTGGVSMHGIALNVSNTLEGFSLVVACGLRGAEMTTLSRELGRAVDSALLRRELADAFREGLPVLTGKGVQRM